MSDLPVRTISGLKPRTGGPDLSRLQRRNRGVSTEQQTPASSAQDLSALPGPESVGKQPSELDAVPAVTKQRPAEAHVDGVSPTRKLESGRTGRLSTYLSVDMLERARATYRATSHLEHDRSFSDFVERAIHAEIVRRETAHNAGERYEADTSRLRPGRPLS
jgi:hypothetical protein